jgi:hypothetical protein
MDRSVLLVALLTLLIAVPVASAQSNTHTNQSTTSGSNGISEGADRERIDNQTVLLSSSYDSENGSATIVLRSEIPQKVTVADGGGFIEGGEVTTRSVYVDAEEPTRIEIPVTETSSGWVGVSISTTSTLYSEPLTKAASGRYQNLGPSESSDLLSLMIGAVLGPLAIYLGYRWIQNRQSRGVQVVD